jgi:GTP pyrophosphokinase
VAYILVELGMDTDCVIAALLHDVVEDTLVSSLEIKKKFGQDIVGLVNGITNLGRIKFRTREEHQAENIRKMFIAMSKDIRVVIIKLADRTNNMRTLECMPEQKRRDKSRETMEIFAPIAHRLGIRYLKEELEDLSLKYLDPIAYEEVEESLALRKADRTRFIALIKRRITDKLKDSFSKVYIEGRVKSINGIYKKIFIRKKNMDEIYDVYAIRVIVDRVNDCYNVLGTVHDLFQPIPNRFKDYISMPKPNMYQSLHTTVMSKEGVPFEVQIRTWDMHRTAEYGIAAHWKYKLGIPKDTRSLKRNLMWVSKMVNEHKDFDITEIIGNIKHDLTPEEIYILTPKGKVVVLPSGATVIDFAYSIHTEIGNKMVGAKVDRRVVPIDYKLKTGEIVDIITTKEIGKGPNRNWLKIARTSAARNKIKQWFKREKREENVIEGRVLVEKELKRNNIVFSEGELLNILDPILKRNQCKSINDFYAAVGYGGIQVWRNMPRLKDEYQKKLKDSEDSDGNNDVDIVKGIIKSKILLPQPRTSPSNGVEVDGMNNILVRFSKCCSPIPGDDIIGFITRNSGISIHNTKCKNVPKDLNNKNTDADKWKKAYWINYGEEVFKANIEVVSEKKESLLANITKMLSLLHVQIISLNSRTISFDRIIVDLTITVKDAGHIKDVMNSVRGLSGVISVLRI